MLSLIKNFEKEINGNITDVLRTINPPKNKQLQKIDKLEIVKSRFKNKTLDKPRSDLAINISSLVNNLKMPSQEIYDLLKPILHKSEHLPVQDTYLIDDFINIQLELGKTIENMAKDIASANYDPGVIKRDKKKKADYLLVKKTNLQEIDSLTEIGYSLLVASLQKIISMNHYSSTSINYINNFDLGEISSLKKFKKTLSLPFKIEEMIEKLLLHKFWLNQINKKEITKLISRSKSLHKLISKNYSAQFNIETNSFEILKNKRKLAKLIERIPSVYPHKYTDMKTTELEKRSIVLTDGVGMPTKLLQEYLLVSGEFLDINPDAIIFISSKLTSNIDRLIQKRYGRKRSAPEYFFIEKRNISINFNGKECRDIYKIEKDVNKKVKDLLSKTKLDINDSLLLTRSILIYEMLRNYGKKKILLNKKAENWNFINKILYSALFCFKNTTSLKLDRIAGGDVHSNKIKDPVANLVTNLVLSDEILTKCKDSLTLVPLFEYIETTADSFILYSLAKNKVKLKRLNDIYIKILDTFLRIISIDIDQILINNPER